MTDIAKQPIKSALKNLDTKILLPELKNNIDIIFIIASIGLIISFFNSAGAQAAGYLIVIITQAIWLVILTSEAEGKYVILYIINIVITIIQLICLYYILITINFGPEYSNYPKEYKVYNNLSHASIFVMLLLQYFVAIPLTSISLDKNKLLAKIVFAVINVFLFITNYITNKNF